MTRFGDQNHVFNPYPAFIRYVDAGLNCNYHSRSKLVVLAFRQPREFMDFNSHSMARRVGEISKIGRASCRERV